MIKGTMQKYNMHGSSVLFVLPGHLYIHCRRGLSWFCNRHLPAGNCYASVFIAAWCDKCLPVLHRCQVSGPSCSSVCNVRRSWCETRRCKGAARFCCAFQNFALQAFCLFVSTLIYMKNLYTALTEIYSLR